MGTLVVWSKHFMGLRGNESGKGKLNLFNISIFIICGMYVPCYVCMYVCITGQRLEVGGTGKRKKKAEVRGPKRNNAGSNFSVFLYLMTINIQKCSSFYFI